MLENVKKVYFIGIGGVGMSALAQILISMGYRVSGSDPAKNSYISKLKAMGADINRNHDGKHVLEADLVVYSSIIPPDNPERRLAAGNSIKCVHRGVLLRELMKNRRGIAVTGTHGKTTTAAMLAALFLRAGLDPTVAIGGSHDAIGGNARLGKGKYFVCEADESDGSFLELAPRFAVITNIENDHVEHYGGFAELKTAFREFAERVFENGGIIAFSDHAANKEVLGGINPEQSIMYGFGDACPVRAADYVSSPGASSFSVHVSNREIGVIDLPVPGIYNAYNALGAVSLSLYLGIGFREIREELAVFRGVERRFQKMGEVNGIEVVEDYAHHPGELAGLLGALKESGRRIVSVFQPHRYTRTKQLAEGLGESLFPSDVVIITDIYPAGEKETGGASSEAIAGSMAARGHLSACHVPNKEDVPGRVAEIARRGDMVLVLGAGDINEITPGILSRLEERNGAGGG